MELHAQIACAMPRELAKKGLGWQDRAVYAEALFYGRENLTDGVIDRAELMFWMPDMPVKERTRRLNDIRDKGALIDHPQGWAFPDHVWRKWGKTKAEVEAIREAEKQRKADYRARRRDATQTSGNVPTGQRVYATSPGEQPYPEPKPEPYPEPITTPSTSLHPAGGKRRDIEAVVTNLFPRMEDIA